jgi:hypothetical protein
VGRIRAVLCTLALVAGTVIVTVAPASAEHTTTITNFGGGRARLTRFDTAATPWTRMAQFAEVEVA